MKSKSLPRKNKQIVLYSAMLGNYDIIQKINAPDNWECVMFTDLPEKKRPSNSGWIFKNIDKKLGKDGALINRWYKLHPHILFPDIDQSIYVDSNINIIDFKYIERRIQELKEKSVYISLPKHFQRDCIYQEANAVIISNKDKSEKVIKTIELLKSSNYPENHGLYENNLIYRKHNKEIIISLMEDWWGILNTYSQRDQLSLCYIMWKKKIKSACFFENGDTVRNRHDMKYIPHIIKKNKKKILANVVSVFIPVKSWRHSLRKSILHSPSEKAMDLAIRIKLSNDKKMLNISSKFKPNYFNIHRCFFYNLGKFPNIINPRGFNEKIQWLKLFDQNPLMPVCSDKYKVRDYIKEKSPISILTHLYGVYDSYDEIDFEVLPRSFVIKVNHLSGGVYLIEDKYQMNHKEYKEKIHHDLLLTHGVEWGEWPYGEIEKKIIIEEFIHGAVKKAPADYKYHCANGEVKFIQYICDREEATKEIILDAAWKALPFHLDEDFKLLQEPPKRPINLEEMNALATKLSEDFKYVRVDLYNIEGRIYFGELTFFPKSGFYPSKDSEYLGDFISIK